MSQVFQKQKKPKAVIPAAGFGSRLRPLTNSYAKASLPIFDVPTLYFILNQLRRYDICEIAVNAHYRSNDIKTLINENPFSELKLTYAFEAEILGSGGIYLNLSDFLANQTFIVYNGDILSDINLDSLIETHRSSQALATLAVTARVPFGQQATISVNANHEVIDIAQSEPSNHRCYHGAGVFVFESRLLSYLSKNTPSSLTPALRKALDAGETLKVYLHQGFWSSVGDSISAYWKTHKRILSEFNENRDPLDIKQLWARLSHRYHLGKTSAVHDSVRVEPVDLSHSIVSSNVKLNTNNRLDHCLILPNACLSPSGMYRRLIISPNHQLPIQIIP